MKLYSSVQNTTLTRYFSSHPPHYISTDIRKQQKQEQRQQQGGSLHLSLLIVFTANNSLESLDSCVSRRDDLGEVPERKSLYILEYGIVVGANMIRLKTCDNRKAYMR